jgi:alcohol dehydrogenase
MSTLDHYDFHCRVKFAVGGSALEHLPLELEGLDARMPMVIAQRPADAAPVLRALRDSGLTLAVVDRAGTDEAAVLDLARLHRLHRCDAVVAVGCGALADAAKALGLVVSTGAQNLPPDRGATGLAGPLQPLAIVPTVGGWAGETAPAAALGAWRMQSPLLMPDLLVIDPRLTRAWEPAALIAMGLAALSLASEALLGTRVNGIAQSYAQGAVTMVAAHLLAAVKRKADPEGPAALVNAAGLAGCLDAAQEPGLNRELALALAPACRLPVGSLMGLLLPYTLAFLCLKRQHCPESLLLPLAGPEIFATADRSLRPHVAINALHALLHDLQRAAKGALPPNLAEAGIARPALEECARQVAARPGAALQEREALLIVEHAWEGRPIVIL